MVLVIPLSPCSSSPSSITFHIGLDRVVQYTLALSWPSTSIASSVTSRSAARRLQQQHQQCHPLPSSQNGHVRHHRGCLGGTRHLSSSAREISNHLLRSTSSLSPTSTLLLEALFQQRRAQRTTKSNPIHSRNFSSSLPYSSSPKTKDDPHLRSLPLADIGEGITEVEVLQWHVHIGSVVEEFQRLCEVQSDKASVEITSRYAGVVERLGAKEGEVIKVGRELCAIRLQDDEGVNEVEVEANTLAIDAGKAAEMEQGSSTASVQTNTPLTSRRQRHPRDNNEDQSSIPTSPLRKGTTRQEHIRSLAAPAVRRLCREHSLDLGQIIGTGKEGRVTKEDVLIQLGTFKKGDNAAGDFSRAMQLEEEAQEHAQVRGTDVPGEENLACDNVQTRASAAAAMSSTRDLDSSPDDALVTQPLSGIRKAMFKSLSLSAHIPHFTFSEELDVTDLEALRSKINYGLSDEAIKERKSKGSDAGVEGVEPTSKLTLLPFLMKALSHAMYSHPLFRSKLSLPPTSSSAPSIEQYASLASEARLIGPRSSHDIAFALSTPAGLLTPVMRNVEKLSVQEIASELNRLQSLARSPSGLRMADLQGWTSDHCGSNSGKGSRNRSSSPQREGGTLILSNIGSLGCGTSASPLLPPTGELAIGAICAVKRGFRWSDDPSLAFLPSAPRSRWGGAGKGAGTRGSDDLVDEFSAVTDPPQPRMIPRLLAPVTFAGDHRVLQGTELALFVKEWKWWVEHPEMWLAVSR